MALLTYIKSGARKVLTGPLYPLYRILYLRPRSIVRFRRERATVRGRDIATTDMPSIGVFTTNKCASMFLGRLLNEFAKASGHVRIDYDSYFASVGISARTALAQRTPFSRAFRRCGYAYGPMRSYRRIPSLSDYRMLLVLRDPRDVLVSNYFSVRYTHAPISSNVIRMGRDAERLGIDAFVLARAKSKFLPRYVEYLDNLYGSPGVKFYRYEEMIADPKDFLQTVQAHFGIPLPAEVCERIEQNELALPEREDLARHRRSGRPGGFRAKLRPETIRELDSILRKPLNGFGFAEA